MTHCDQCEVREACKLSMGEYWQDKSHGGEGCKNPLTAQQADAIIKAEQMRDALTEWWDDYLERYAEAEDRLARGFPSGRCVWVVKHGGRVFEVWAVSREDAINNVRFRLYGKTPETDLLPFHAMPKISAGDVLAAMMDRALQTIANNGEPPTEPPQQTPAQRMAAFLRRTAF